MNPSVVHVAAWGAQWVERARHEALRCLSYNLATLAPMAPVRVMLSTDDATLAGLFERAEVNLVDDPRDASASRDLLGACEAWAMDAAIADGADFFPLCADHVFPRQHLAAVKVLLAGGFRAVVGTGVRCRRDMFHGIWMGHDVPLQAGVFHFIVMHSLHPAMAGYWVAEPVNVAPANVHQLLYTAPGGFDVVQGQATMFGLRCDGLAPGFHRPPRAECQLLADLCDDPAREIAFIDDPSQGVALTGLDGDEGLTRFGEFPATEAEFARTAKIFERGPRDAALWAWSASHRVPYRFSANAA